MGGTESAAGSLGSKATVRADLRGGDQKETEEDGEEVETG
jgi:hypothetical protein